MTRQLQGKRVAITGGARGIGLATAQALREQGAQVVVGDIDAAACEDVATRLGIPALRLDVTDRASFAEFLDRAEEELGGLDVLVNNAGVMPIGALVDESDEVTRRILDINTYGVITGTKLAAQRMVLRGTGHIVNVASMAGEMYSPGLATYCASKFAVVGFTDAIRVELAASGVKVSAVLPTFVNTELTAGTSGIPGFRNAEPEDIAAGIVALVAKPKAKVRVTRAAGMLLGSQKHLPRPISEFLLRRFGGETQFLDGVDTAKRRAYEDRARGTAGPAEQPVAEPQA